MPSNLDALGIRKRLGRDYWRTPQPHGPDGWSFLARDRSASVIVSCAEHDDGREWVHASFCRYGEMPSYDDLVVLHEAVWHGHGYAYQVFAPAAAHVNIHPTALHLWGLLDGSPALPDFAPWGSI